MIFNAFSSFIWRGISVAALVSCMVVLTGCASPKISPKYQLKTVATEDDSKRFTYGFFAKGPGGGPGSQPSARGGTRDRGVNFRDMREELGVYMEITGYCSDGYFIYDETFNGREYLLHGECQESKAGQ